MLKMPTNTVSSAIVLIMLVLPLSLILCSCKKDSFLSEAEKQALFASPTAEEIDAVYTGWQSRNLSPADYTIISQDTIQGRFIFKIVSFKVNNITEYGALLIPDTDSIMPVRMYVGGFGLNQAVNSLSLSLDSSGSAGNFILAVPALRGQSLEITVNGKRYTSPLSEGNHCNAFDGATDDVLAFLNLIGQTEARADINRTSVRGGSRGGTVALLAGIRDKRIKRCAGIVSPADLLTLTSRNENDATYRCQFLSDFKNGQASLAETRHKMIASSPLYFAFYLPLTQLHLGLRDDIVPVSQGYELENKMKELGRESDFQLFTYDRTHADIAADNDELVEKLELFLSKL